MEKKIDQVKLAFEIFKNNCFKCKNQLKQNIKKQFKDISDKELNETVLEIYNYQVGKYDSPLYFKNTDSKSVILARHRAAKERRNKRYAKREYY